MGIEELVEVMLTLVTFELIPIVLDKVEDNNQAREVVRLPAAEGPEVRFCFFVFSNKNSQGLPSLDARC